MNRLDEQYRAILGELLYNGKKKGDRTGTGTLSKFGMQIRHRMSDGFPLLTTKKMAVKTMMTELKWFLRGDTNIKYLVDNGCNIWNGDAYKSYEKYVMGNSYGVDVLSMDEFINEIKTNDEFAEINGELGPIYGKQWRNWRTDTVSIDQIQDLISELKTNPDSRRLMVNAWNVDALEYMTLPPCHYGFQVYTRELSESERFNWYGNKKGSHTHLVNIVRNPDNHIIQEMNENDVPKRAISLMWNQRSVDTFLGLPFNIASYGTLLQLIADECDMIAGELIGNLGDTHLYKNHIQQAKEQINREPYPLPTIELSNIDIFNGEWDYEIKGYEYHPTIKAPLSN